jgi:hypothetical protein
MGCGQTNERLTVRDTINETTGLRYVRMASDRAHANDGVMSGMGISKVKSQGTIKQTGSYVTEGRRGWSRVETWESERGKDKTES